MGIPFLNRLLRSECKNAVQMISLSELSGKKIAVDTSIYLYKYLANDNLIENFYLMLSLFRHYDIIPVFIFDGKPPAEKKELLIQRIKEKKTAQEEYDRLKELLNTNVMVDEEEKQDVLTNMDALKKKFISIHKTHIDIVKQLIVSYGASYYDAPGEADTLCAKLVLTNKVWACLSEDMDMFVYGTPRVIRYLSLLNHTAVLYNMESILKTLNVNQEEFKEICVLSGTDYNIHKDINKGKKEGSISHPQIYKILNSFREYQQDKVDTDTHGQQTSCFYKWLQQKNTNLVVNYDLFLKICSMFDLFNVVETDDEIKNFEAMVIEKGPILYDKLKDILKTDGFIFPLE